MKPAAEKLAEALKKLRLKAAIPVIANVNATVVEDVERLKEL